MEQVLANFKKIVVCELNMGQFADYLKQNFQQFHYHQINKTEGLPFTVVELKEKMSKILSE
jgi:2-oxoglutarate ferredoxin oxidoreductase subunit alpha